MGQMACHCRSLIHPQLGPVVACISIHSSCFYWCLTKVIPPRWRVLDLERQAVFVHPRYEEVLNAVARSHFGMGRVEDETIFPEMPSWIPDPTGRPPPRSPQARRHQEPDLARALRTLGAEPDATLVQARRAYRRASMRLHPDHGGSTEAMAELNRAWEAVRERLT